jgi:hypothetical protein
MGVSALFLALLAVVAGRGWGPFIAAFRVLVGPASTRFRRRRTGGGGAALLLEYW